jgi:heme exporter protein D
MLDFNAGKYAVFVWSAYGVTAAASIALIVDTLVRARRWRRAAERGEREAKDEAPD